MHTSNVLESDGLTVLVGLFNFCVPSRSNIDRYVFGSRFHSCSTRKPGMSRHNSVGKKIEQPWRLLQHSLVKITFDDCHPLSRRSAWAMHHSGHFIAEAQPA